MEEEFLEPTGPFNMVLFSNSTLEELENQVNTYKRLFPNGNVVLDTLYFLETTGSSYLKGGSGIFARSIVESMHGWIIKSVHFGVTRYTYQLVGLFIPVLASTTRVELTVYECRVPETFRMLGALPMVRSLVATAVGRTSVRLQDMGEWPSLREVKLVFIPGAWQSSMKYILYNRVLEAVSVNIDIVKGLSSLCNTTLRSLTCPVNLDDAASMQRLSRFTGLHKLNVRFVNFYFHTESPLTPLLACPLRHVEAEVDDAVFAPDLCMHPTMATLDLRPGPLSPSFTEDEIEINRKSWMESWPRAEFRVTVARHLPRFLPSKIVYKVAEFAGRSLHDLRVSPSSRSQ